MSSNPDATKELLKYLLMQVKEKRLDADRAKEFIKTIQESTAKADEPIAVVGMAGRFPDAPDKEQFWSNLIDGRESIGDFPPMRVDDLRRADDSTAPLRKGGYLDRIDLFDPEYFGIPPKAAQQLDPYHRTMMEVLIETMEDAGHPASEMHGANAGIFVGNDHTHRLIKSYLPFLSDVDFAAVSGSWSGILASRLSYHLNLHGPAEVIDTGCSSGLVALDAAIKSIRQGDCDSAFVGAINLLLAPFGLGNETESEDFQVRAFDSAANGTVWSEGAGALYIKPLARAVQDRDHIYGVVLSSAVNSDGRSNGLTAPNAQAQKTLLINAWKRADIQPESLSYIEAHGTGTSLGDPIEIKGLTGAFGAFTDKRQFCAMGSVKTNIGHTVGAAGLASLLKTLLSLEHKVIPSSLNFDVPNGLLDLVDSPVYLNDRLSTWDEGATPRRAGVSSFSLTGTNSHVVLEEAPTPDDRPDSGTGVHLYPISARSEELLGRSAARQMLALDRHPDYRLDDVCFTMQSGREHQPVRAVILCENRAGLRDGLRRLLNPQVEDEEPRLNDHTVVLRTTPPSPSADSEPREPGEIPPKAGTGQRMDLPDRFRHLTGVVAGYLDGQEQPFAEFEPAPHARRVPLPPQVFEHTRLWDEDVQPPTAAAPAEALAPGTVGWVRDVLSQPSRLEGADDSQIARTVIARVWSDVLGYPVVRGSDDFFALGGDSVGSLKITQALNAGFDVDIPATTLLATPVFDDFANAVINDFGLDDVLVRARLTSMSDGEIDVAGLAEEYELPLTTSQRGMLVSSGLNEDSVVYNVSGMTISKTTLDVTQLEADLRALTRRHDSLRSTFHMINGEPFQRVHQQVPVAVEHRYLGNLAPGESHEDKAREQMKEFIRPFRLDEAPLFRLGYFEFDDGVTCVAIDIHHIITDGTSMGILFGDLGAISQGSTLPPLQRSYRSAIRELLDRQNHAELLPHRNYWVSRFDDGVPTLQLTTDRQRPDVATSAGATYFTTLDASTLAAAKRYAQEHNLTLYMVLLGVFHQVLSRMSGQDDIVIGAPVMGRPDLTYQDLVGMFVNTLPLRITGESGLTVKNYFSGLKTTVLDAFEHQIYPLESLIEELDPPREPGRRPLFDVCFVHQNIDMGLDREDEQVILVDDGSTKYDITLSTRETDGGLLMEWEYSTTLFSDDTIQLFAERYVTLLRSILATEDDSVIGTLALMPAREIELVQQFATSPAPAVESVGVAGLFEQQVAAAPDKTALIMGDKQMSYKELNAASNRVARALIERGIVAGTPVALLMDRSFDMIVAILGVLKARCHYVPLNTEFPTERLRVMTDDAGVPLVVSTTARFNQAAELGSTQVQVTELNTLTEPINEDTDLGLPSSSDDPIYIMYTSGTTGVPKGSLVRQKSVQRVVRQPTFYSPDATDVFLMLSDYSFDGSIYDMFGALTNGASLVVMDKSSVLDLDRLGAAIQRHQITSFFITAAMFNALIDNATDSLGSIRTMIFGGEMASPTHVRNAFELLGPGRIANGYGPTETTVFAAVHLFDTYDDNDAIPIGRPINDTSLWVLDNRLELQPIGASGELYIGGEGLADGYLNRPDLTEERFVYSPAVPGQRLYKTGDLVTMKSNGLLYYTGRIDQQVKVRGYRIELAEIMHAAMAEPNVTWAHADMYEMSPGSKSLCLWVRYDNEQEGVESRLRSALERRLPSYMVPSFIVATDSVTFTRNGKLDTSALPRPAPPESASTAEPVTEGQRTIAAAWSHVLGVTIDDVDQNFFTLGGDSIKAIQIVAKLKEYGIAIQVTDLLENQTVRLLDDIVSDSSRDQPEIRVYDQQPVSGAITASPIQRAFLADVDNRQRVFNQCLLVTLDEAQSLDRLTAGIQRLTRIHDLLRVEIDDDAGLRLREVDAESLIHAEQAPAGLPETESIEYLRSLQARVNIYGGPTVALAAGLGDDGRQFAIAIHHLAVDVVSWGILLEDLLTCLSDPDGELPPTSMPFSEWTDRLKRFAEDGGFRPQLPYWTELARRAGDPGSGATVDLFDEREVRRSDTVAETVRIEQGSDFSVLEAARTGHAADAAETLVAVVARALAAVTGRDRILFTLEGHGREAFGNGREEACADDSDLGRTVGWFTSTFPHLVQIEDDVEATLQSVRDSFDRLPDRGFGFGALLHLDTQLGEEKEVLTALRPQVGFNYLGEQGGSDDLNVAYAPADVTTDADYRSQHIVDIIAARDGGDIVIDVRYPRSWIDDESRRDLATAITEAFSEARDAFQSRETRGFQTSSSVRQDVLDDILLDIAGGQ